jgi:two-component system response regulator HupR/HoxA
VLDDDPIMLKMMREVLENHYRVEVVENTQQAEFALVDGDHHVLLCDEKLPGESGIAFLTRLKRKHPFLVRIISSGYVNKELLSKAMNEAGVTYVLEKPFDMYGLFKAVRRGVDDSLRLRRLAAIEAEARHRRTHALFPGRMRPARSLREMGHPVLLLSLGAIATLSALAGAALTFLVLYLLKTGWNIALL